MRLFKYPRSIPLTFSHRCLFIWDALADLFVKRLFSSKCIPMVLWNDHRLLKNIQEVFRDCDNSIVSIATKLKSELRRYFSAPGEYYRYLIIRD